MLLLYFPAGFVLLLLRYLWSAARKKKGGTASAPPASRTFGGANLAVLFLYCLFLYPFFCIPAITMGDSDAEEWEKLLAVPALLAIGIYVATLLPHWLAWRVLGPWRAARMGRALLAASLFRRDGDRAGARELHTARFGQGWDRRLPPRAPGRSPLRRSRPRPKAIPSGPTPCSACSASGPGRAASPGGRAPSPPRGSPDRPPDAASGSARASGRRRGRGEGSGSSASPPRPTSAARLRRSCSSSPGSWPPAGSRRSPSCGAPWRRGSFPPTRRSPQRAGGRRYRRFSSLRGWASISPISTSSPVPPRVCR